MMEQKSMYYLQCPDPAAAHDRTVILGSGDDVMIPLNELAERFALGSGFCNRSAAELSMRDAAAYYTAVAAPLQPARVILHLGESDAAWAASSPAAFDGAFRALIHAIRTSNNTCRIGVVTLRNPTQDVRIAALNQRLAMLAASEQCEFEDIAAQRVWNPETLAYAMQFVSVMGAGSRNGKSLYDLAKIFFCKAAKQADTVSPACRTIS